MTIDREVATSVDRHVVTMADLVGLPEPARRYLRFMGAVGRPRDRSFRLEWIGRFRMGPERNWMACEATQSNTSDPIARDFRLRVRFGGIVPVVAHDTYSEGHGHMSAKAFGLMGKKRVSARWSTPIDGWRDLGGRIATTGARAMWHLPGRSFAYAEVRPKPGTLAYDEIPTEGPSGHGDIGLTAVSGATAKSGHEVVSEVAP